MNGYVSLFFETLYIYIFDRYIYDELRAILSGIFRTDELSQHFDELTNWFGHKRTEKRTKCWVQKVARRLVHYIMGSLLYINISYMINMIRLFILYKSIC